jgi:hypothetical protein
VNEAAADAVQPKHGGLLLVTHTLEDPPKGGRAMLSRVNADALQEIYGEQFQLFELNSTPAAGLGAIVKALRGEIDGVDQRAIEQVLAITQRAGIGTVFVDGSNLGELVRAIRKALPEVRLVTFFHNVESRFFLGALRQSKTGHSLGVFLANYLAEGKAVKYSDRLLCLSQRDSQQLNATYGRPGTDICPMALKDQVTDFEQESPAPVEGPYALFVGGAFYANLAGIRWYAAQVAPKLTIPTCVVGRGFEQHRGELEILGNIKVMGEVESLGPWYHHARVVVAPIFDGSGMKTKVAEALMHGKRVFGTPEAFVGYEAHADKAGVVCRDEAGFVSAIEQALMGEVSHPEATLRSLYLEEYSTAAAKQRLRQALLAGHPVAMD